MLCMCHHCQSISTTTASSVACHPPSLPASTQISQLLASPLLSHCLIISHRCQHQMYHPLPTLNAEAQMFPHPPCRLLDLIVSSCLHPSFCPWHLATTTHCCPLSPLPLGTFMSIKHSCQSKDLSKRYHQKPSSLSTTAIECPAIKCLHPPLPTIDCSCHDQSHLHYNVSTLPCCCLTIFNQSII